MIQGNSVLLVSPSHWLNRTYTNEMGQQKMLESSEANTLILEASKDGNGMILRVESIGSISISTNGREFSTGLSARELAYLEDGLSVLIQFGYLNQVVFGQAYVVTKRGYEYADSLATQQ